MFWKGILKISLPNLSYYKVHFMAYWLIFLAYCGDGQSGLNEEGVVVCLYIFTATDFLTHKRAGLLLLPQSYL